MSKPVDTVQFWKERLQDALLSGNIRHAVYKAPEKEWREICQHHKDILDSELLVDDHVLDAGCGYGRLLDLAHIDKKKYVGVDLSPDLIACAQQKYPGYYFMRGNLEQLPFEDNAFDIAVCISVMIMVVENIGWSAWERIQNELLRVTRRGIICLEYGTGDTLTESSTYYRIYETLHTA